MFKLGQRLRFKSSVSEKDLRKIYMNGYTVQNIFTFQGYRTDFHFSGVDVDADGFIIPESYLESTEMCKRHPLTKIFRD